jgi:hypothetical protein
MLGTMEYKSKFGNSLVKRDSSKNSSDKSKSPLKKSSMSLSASRMSKPPGSDVKRLSTANIPKYTPSRPSISPGPTQVDQSYDNTRSSNENFIYNAMKTSIDKKINPVMRKDILASEP